MVLTIRSEWAGSQIERVREAELRIEAADNWGISAVLLRGTAELWRDILEASSVAIQPSNKPAHDFQGEDTLLAEMDRSAISGVVNRLAIVRVSDDAEARELVLSALDEVTRSLGMATEHRKGAAPDLVDEAGNKEDPRAQVTMWRHRARMLGDTMRAVPLMSSLGDELGAATERLTEAKAALDQAKTDLDEIRNEIISERAERGKYKLADHYKKLGRSQRWASHFFRAVTLGLIGGAAYISYKAADGATAHDWTTVASHLAIALAIAGGSAYTARLGSLHRTTADWAKGIEVQLETVDDFLGTIDDTTVKQSVYQEFSRRVLGAPPSASGDDPAPLPVAQIIELANALRK